MPTKRRLTIATLGVVVVVLLIAAANPKATYEVITTPAEMLEKRAREHRKAQSHKEWAAAYEQAMAGVPKAQYRVGRVMQGQRWGYGTGIAPDSSRGDSLVNAAAAAGYPGALYHLWRESEGSLDELLPLYRRVIAEGYTDSLDMTLLFIASSVGLEAQASCNRELWYDSYEALMAHWEVRALNATPEQREKSKRMSEAERETIEAYFDSGCTVFNGVPVKRPE